MIIQLSIRYTQISKFIDCCSTSIVVHQLYNTFKQYIYTSTLIQVHYIFSAPAQVTLLPLILQ